MQSNLEKSVRAGVAKIWKAVKWLWALAGKVPYLRPVLLMLVLGVVIYQTQCGTSENERQLEQQTNQTIEKTGEEKAAELREEQAETSAREADKTVTETRRSARPKIEKAKEARNANVKGTSYEEANRERCLTYPESEECSK